MSNTNDAVPPSHEHPGGDVPHAHGPNDAVATRDSTLMNAGRDDTTRTMQLREEELLARKNAVEAGAVQVRKEVVTEQRTMEVPLTREEVFVERRPVDRRPADNADFGEGQERISVPVREERVTGVEKRPVVTEEISVGKRVTQETQQVSGTVRREEARVEGEGDVKRREP